TTRMPNVNTPCSIAMATPGHSRSGFLTVVFIFGPRILFSNPTGHQLIPVQAYEREWRTVSNNHYACQSLMPEPRCILGCRLGSGWPARCWEQGYSLKKIFR